MSKIIMPPKNEREKFKGFKVQLVITAVDDNDWPWMILTTPLDVSMDTQLRNCLQRALSILHQGNGQEAYLAACKVEDALVELYWEETLDKQIVIAAPPGSPAAKHGSDLLFWQNVMPEEFGKPEAEAEAEEKPKTMPGDIRKILDDVATYGFGDDHPHGARLSEWLEQTRISDEDSALSEEGETNA